MIRKDQERRIKSGDNAWYGVWGIEGCKALGVKTWWLYKGLHWMTSI
jgi:hypothetical protein